MGISSVFGIVPALAVMVSLAVAPAVGADVPPDPKDLVKTALVAETQSVAPASTLWVGLHLAIKPGWHIY